MPKLSVTVGGDHAAEPIEFELNGRDTNGRAIAPITFRCKPAIQGVLIKDILDQADNPLAAGVAVIGLIPHAVVPEQLQLYEDVTHSSEIIVDASALADIGKWLFEVYNQNPTSGPLASTAGPSPTGPTSMADYLSQPEPTLRPSAPVVSATPSTP